MIKVVGVRFRLDGKIYEFDCGHFVLKRGDKVIVVTEMGMSLGEVVCDPRKMDSDIPHRELKEVYRLATQEDIQQAERNLEIERDSYKHCHDCIQKRGLSMNLVSVEALFDLSKIIFYFTAEGRVDFRELVKDLVQRLHTRIEMRQIGVRNQAKMVGGIGNCGRELCCTQFIKHFDPVSVKMAKEQNLSLNPAKISGACGRLMCCLAYEYDQYTEMKKNLPKCGQTVCINESCGKIVRQNAIKSSVTVALEDGREVEVPSTEICNLKFQKKNQSGTQT
jgi:cell fate regulator YaaT (PSP1 superfamily)